MDELSQYLFEPLWAEGEFVLSRSVRDAALEPLLASMETAALVLLLAGGMIYSGGVFFHLSHRLPYHRALWHACVLAGAAFHYLAIVMVLPA